MNDHDKANLEFIMSVDKETLAAWYKTLSEDDIAYAQELVARASLALEIRVIEMNDNVTDTIQANTVLNKYRLNK